MPVDGVARNSATNHLVTEAYRHAIATNFFTGAALAATAFAIVLALPEIPLRTRRSGESGPIGGLILRTYDFGNS